MTDSILGHPAAPAEGGTYGGFADIARRLNALHPERSKPISRQLVHRWFMCRGSNGFPERQPKQIEGGKEKSLFDLDAVERWHRTMHRPRRVPPPIETIPMFSVDGRGGILV